MTVNIAHEARGTLAERHYVVKGSGVTYFTQFTSGKIRGKQLAHGDNFCLVIIGCLNTVDDFYVIPWGVVCGGFSDSLLHETLRPTGHIVRRWVCHIRNGILQISKVGVETFEVDVAPYRGNMKVASAS